MSDFALKPVVPHHSVLRIVIDWLKQAKVAASLPGLETMSPPDPLVSDLGLDGKDILRKVDRGAVEIGLLSLGWQPPRTSPRR